MKTNMRRAGLFFIALCCAAAAGAQPAPTGAQQAPPPAAAIPQTAAPSAAATDARPATTTFLGDTGIWFVPTAEVLPAGAWSASGYRRGTNYIQGYTSVADLAGSFAIGIADRIEVFGAVLANTRLDRDLEPVFVNDPAYGGFIDRYPRVTSAAPVDAIGDSFAGAKINLLSQQRGYAGALAVRAVLKLPTGDDRLGAGTGRTDASLEAIGSREFAARVEVATLLGYTFQGQPAGFTIPSGAFTWGAAAVYPSRGAFRVFAEASGAVPSSDVASRSVPLVGVDGSTAPSSVQTEDLTRLTTGLTWQTRGGLFIGAGVSWTGPHQERVESSQTNHTFGDYRDWQIRIGFHPGVRPLGKSSTRG